MSSEKKIKINKEYFIPRSKTRNNTSHEKKTRPIVDSNMHKSSKKLKDEMCKKIKDYQKNKEIEKIKDQKSETNTSQIDVDSETSFS